MSRSEADANRQLAKATPQAIPNRDITTLLQLALNSPDSRPDLAQLELVPEESEVNCGYDPYNHIAKEIK